MKILKYILIILAVIIIIPVVIGLTSSTINYGAEINVNKPVEEAWAISKDETKFDQWLEGFKSIELIEGERDQVGSKYKVVVNPGEGQEDFVMTETLVAMNEHENIEMHFDSDMMKFEQIMTYTEVDGGTTIKTESKVIPKSFGLRMMFGTMQMLGGAFDKQEAKNMNALKKLIDENTTDYSPVVEDSSAVMDSSAVEEPAANEE
ncbi:MAG: SRPBCC family protein [Bacteroidia bacterium]|nr:SRPBCC family protein [Bacteroidia bacterium]NNC84516.1 SRPBCC family protein [Bacteroidia bacterium]